MAVSTYFGHMEKRFSPNREERTSKVSNMPLLHCEGCLVNVDRVKDTGSKQLEYHWGC
jgi:hypothetical protein